MANKEDKVLYPVEVYGNTDEGYLAKEDAQRLFNFLFDVCKCNVLQIYIDREFDYTFENIKKEWNKRYSKEYIKFFEKKSRTYYYNLMYKEEMKQYKTEKDYIKELFKRIDDLYKMDDKDIKEIVDIISKKELKFRKPYLLNTSEDIIYRIFLGMNKEDLISSELNTQTEAVYFNLTERVKKELLENLPYWDGLDNFFGTYTKDMYLYNDEVCVLKLWEPEKTYFLELNKEQLEEFKKLGLEYRICL